MVNRDVCVNPQKRWQRIQVLIDHVWKRWLKEWLPTQRERSKWRTDHQSIQPGDVVFVLQAEVSQGKWLLGRVMTVFPGSDGRVRVAEVKTQNGVITRSINRLSIVERAEQT